MIDTRNIHSLTDFLRHHKTHVARLRASGQPQVLTVNGRAELVIQDAASYQDILDRLERAEGRKDTGKEAGAPATSATEKGSETARMRLCELRAGASEAGAAEKD